MRLVRVRPSGRAGQPGQLIERQLALQQSQLRRSRQLGTSPGPLRQPMSSPASRRQMLNE